MPSWLLLLLGLSSFFSFMFILFLLPDDAYGEEDTRVYSEEKIRARNRTHVLVLGDIGRSPRMQNHALSLARRNIAVDLIGYTDSELHPEIAQRKFKYLTVHPIRNPPKILQTDNRILFLVLGPLKVIFQFWALWMILGHDLKPARSLLVQVNSQPQEMVHSMVFNGSNLETESPIYPNLDDRFDYLIIDWHNTGYSILALKLGPKHPMVRISRIYERWFSHSAAVNFTVSDAMKRQLKRDFSIKAPLLRLYDRPTADFGIVSPEERLKFLKDIDLSQAQQASLENGRLKVLISSTSWTPDEDFSLLLDALVSYSKLAVTTHPQLPELLVVITGKGPQQAQYIRKIESLEKDDELEMVKITTAWLPRPAYAMLLASADLGISLHKSSSGVDLPMKVVDMFGAGLPVVGYGLYESWPELVKEGVNGRSFGDSKELESILVQLLGDDGSKLASLRSEVSKESQHDWNTEWDSVASKIFQSSE
ncbi:MAG: hypothetical protein LQ340_001176 [Diploschistes diacapsis]|nr:MAG: hypothetical protein LQ340_001176 [Diploschistes diacapsis]